MPDNGEKANSTLAPIQGAGHITTGIERFLSLLEVEIDLSRKLFVVTPKSRSRKLADVIKTSKYFGYPMYVENKVGFVYKEDLEEFYETHVTSDFKETDLKVILNDIPTK